MENRLLEVKNLKTYFHTFKGIVKAVDGVSFDLKKGEILGIVGESGGGKSVTGFSLLKLIEEPGKIEEGQILFKDEDIVKMNEKEMKEIRGSEISMIFQDPMTSLNPLYTIQQQMEEVLKLHTEMNAKQRKKRCIQLLKDVGIPQPSERLNSYPHQFSGGMRQRVIIATALAAEPELIIADEPTTALDVTIQSQILKLMGKLVKEKQTSLILITHDLAVVSEMADRVIVLYCGKVLESGSIDDIIYKSAHPYTNGLLNSIPRLHDKKSRLSQIPGMVPNMFALPVGCNFAPRCSYSQEKCKKTEPHIREIFNGHRVSCHYPLKGADS
ncbi:MAG TPA: ABC transporter ATP-binding protein [Halanaerobiales bacterium]|nr:ABC transporter ATP-binding protein [Halanaerobiales bacterium]